MRKLLNFVIVVLVLCYPFVVFWGISYLSPRYLGLIIILVFILRFLFIQQKKSALMGMSTLLIAIVGIVLCAFAMISNNIFTIRLYPFAINLLLLAVFIYSLINPPTIIEKFARLKDKQLPKEVINYTRKVTVVWCIFFFCNGLVALYTALFSSLRVWTFYNGLLSYILIGLLFIIEFIIRQFVKKKIVLSQKKNR